MTITLELPERDKRLVEQEARDAGVPPAELITRILRERYGETNREFFERVGQREPIGTHLGDLSREAIYAE